MFLSDPENVEESVLSIKFITRHIEEKNKQKFNNKKSKVCVHFKSQSKKCRKISSCWPLGLVFLPLNWQWAARAAEAVLLNLLEEIISTSQTSIITLLLRHPTSKLNRSHWSQKSNRQLEIKMRLIQTTLSFDWRDSRIFMRWKIYICCQIVTLCLPFVFKTKF